MKRRNRESQEDLIRNRLRVIINTNYAKKHNDAKVN